MKLLVAAGFLGAAFYTNIAIGLTVLGAGLGAAAFVIWFKNRHGLRALNEFLAEQARAGHQAIAEQRPISDGA